MPNSTSLPEVVLVQNTFINVKSDEEELPRTISDQTHARKRQPILVSKIETIEEATSAEWHPESHSMGILSSDGLQFTKTQFDGRLSMITEHLVRSSGVMRYVVELTSGHLSAADGIGFIFYDKLPCRINIQLIDSIFISRKGQVCIRLHGESTLKYQYICPLEIGMSVEMVVDLDKYTVTFSVYKEACLGSAAVNFAEIVPRLPHGALGFFCAILKNSGTRLTFKP